jgi:hypothetical protein
MEVKSIFIAIFSTILISTASWSRQDGPTPFEKCRFVTKKDLSDPKAPMFESYPLTSHEAVSNPKLDLTSNSIARRYRTVLRLETAEGPNYAGHYRLAIWGCGMSCAMFAVVNLNTGKVITPEGFSTVLGIHIAADDFLPIEGSASWGFRYKRDSTLLAVVGALDEDESREGAYYFVLKGERLRPVHSTVVKKNCESLRR